MSVLDTNSIKARPQAAEDARLDPRAQVSPDARLRKLAMDNDDLRFENARLQKAVEQAQREIMALTERNTALQHRLDRILRLAPWGSTKILSRVASFLGRS